VHKSGDFTGTNDRFSNICFSHLVELQYYIRNGIELNACHFHPLGPMWRELFCEAIDYTNTSTPETDSFCDDGCWYRGRRSTALKAHVDDGRWCRPIHTLGGVNPGMAFKGGGNLVDSS